MDQHNRRSLFLFLPFVLPLLSACESRAEIDPQELAAMGFVPMFDGKSLEGWRCVPEDHLGDWSVRDGSIVGTGSEDQLVYLVWREEDLADFELKFSYRMLTDGNSGVQIRGRVDTSGKRSLAGYHADFGHVGIGPGVLGAWDFHFAEREEFACERGTSLVIDGDGTTHYTKIEDAVTKSDMNKGEWNHVHVTARGNSLQFKINGKVASEFTDNHPERLERGMIGFQIHDKGMQVAFKDLWIKRL